MVGDQNPRPEAPPRTKRWGAREKRVKKMIEEDRLAEE